MLSVGMDQLIGASWESQCWFVLELPCFFSVYSDCNVIVVSMLLYLTVVYLFLYNSMCSIHAKVNWYWDTSPYPERSGFACIGVNLLGYENQLKPMRHISCMQQPSNITDPPSISSNWLLLPKILMGPHGIIDILAVDDFAACKFRHLDITFLIIVVVFLSDWNHAWYNRLSKNQLYSKLDN